MTGSDHRHEGHGGARTAVAPDFQPAEQPGFDQVQQLLGQIAPQASLPGLADEPADTVGLLAKAAETLNAQRRARGRPAGSPNRRNDEVFDYLEARGFKQPERYLAELISADPLELAKAVAGYFPGPVQVTAERVMEVMRLQLKAAEALMPYKFAKKQELKVEHSGGQVHVMMAGPLTRPGDTPATAFDLTGGAVEIIEHSATAQGTVGQVAVGPSDQAIEQDQQSTDKPAV